MSAGPQLLAVRAATAEDLPRLQPWLGAAATLPGAAHEPWLVVTGGEHGLLAALRLVPGVGLELPRVSYHVGCVVHAARELGLFQRQRTLLLGHDHTGASELAQITTHPALGLVEQAQALRALLRAALAHIAVHRSAFAARLIVELPGPRDAGGRSPFWEGLGRHFYGADPAAAAARHGPAWRSHVAPLLPRQVIYTSFLPPAAQAAIAQVAAPARALQELLEDAGLRYSHHVNVEDGGPILEADIDELLHSVRR